jgi:hypothetical protein
MPDYRKTALRRSETRAPPKPSKRTPIGDATTTGEQILLFGEEDAANEGRRAAGVTPSRARLGKT